MAVTLFAGCSYSNGNGFALEQSEPDLWINLLHSQNDYLKDTELLNVSYGGRANSGIFQDAVYGLLHNDVKYAFVQWTSMPRYNMSLGLELYETRASFIPNSPLVSHTLNDITYTSNYLNNLRDRFTALPNLHFEICCLVSYVNSLVALAELKETKIFFVNGLAPWDKDYFNCLVDVLPEEYTPFTKKLINVDNRSDDEIFKLYDKIHNEYNKLGTIQADHWLNLHQSMRDLIIDRNLDGRHPGIKSNHLYYQLFNQTVNKKLQTSK